MCMDVGDKVFLPSGGVNPKVGYVTEVMRYDQIMVDWGNGDLERIHRATVTKMGDGQ